MGMLGVMKRNTAFVTPKADTVNLAGGTAYTISDAAQRLISIVGSPGFNEPREYYTVPTNPDLARKFNGSLDGLTGAAKEVVSAAVDVARSDNPRDLLRIAAWLRTEGHCRQTPLVLLAIAAKEVASRPFVREYAPRIIQRADELAGAYAAYRFLFGKPISAALLKGIKDAFANFDEYQLVKYNRPGDNPSMKDVLLQLPDRKPGKPLSRGVAEYLINGSLVDKNGVNHSDTAPYVAKYLAFLKRANELGNKLNPELLSLAHDAKINWEVLISMFGSSKETWNAVIPNMGYMALLRNLRNILTHDADIGEVLKDLTSEKAVLGSKQYPFRFFSALRELNALTGQVDTGKLKKVKDAVANALDISVKNVGEVPGDSIVIIDCSGSMTSPVSAMSSVSMKEAAACLAAVMFKACTNAYVYAFAEGCQLLDLRQNSSAIDVVDKVLGANVGFATYAYKAMQDATEKKLKASRIILLSDMQCYHDGSQNLQHYLTEYKRTVNSNVWFHSINMNSHDASSQVAPANRINLLSGFSDKILATLLSTESGANGIPTLEYIRSKF